MATLRLLPLFFLLLLSLIVTQITSHAPPEAVEHHSSELGDSADLKHELDRLKSQISFLESIIKERSHASSNKDENIRDSEVPVQEKSDSMQPLENEIEYLQHKASVDGKKETSKSHARASELEKQVHGEWLPHWLAIHVYHVQSYMASHWNESWRSALDMTIQKVFEKKDQLKSWAVAQIRDVETEVKKFSEPYVNHFVMVTSRYETMQAAFEPYINKTIHAYRKLIKSASIYHHQVQETLKSHELTRPLAAWFPGNDEQKTKGTH